MKLSKKEKISYMCNVMLSIATYGYVGCRAISVLSGNAYSDSSLATEKVFLVAIFALLTASIIAHKIYGNHLHNIVK